MFRPTALLTFLLASLLTACGGDSNGSVVGSADSSNTDSTDSDSETATSLITYFPLQVYEQGSDYVAEDLFQGIWFEPLIHGYMIAPVDAETLEAATSPSIDEFRVTIDDADVDPQEQGLIMQKVIGLQVSLDTAIIIDTSSSMQSVDKAAFIQEVKDFISQAQASSDPVIRDQRFTLWAFGTDVEALVSDFTTDASVLNSALTDIESNWDSRGSYSAIYQSIVRSVGSYVGSGSSDLSSVIDMSLDGDNDLVDGYRYNASYSYGLTLLEGINLSNVIIFTAGNNSVNYFDVDTAKSALYWQSFLVYNEEAAEEVTSDETTDTTADTVTQDGMTLLGKPLLYVSVGDSVDTNLSALSAVTIEANSPTDFSNVAEQLITAQKSATELRTRPENQYLVRYSVPERDGKHTLVFASDTANYNYTLTTELDLSTAAPWPEAQVSPAVEITGPDNSYLAANTVSLSEVTKLYPATRWTTTDYTGAYEWKVNGVTVSPATDGSITLTSADVGTVTLTNTNLSSGTVTASVTVTN